MEIVLRKCTVDVIFSRLLFLRIIIFVVFGLKPFSPRRRQRESGSTWCFGQKNQTKPKTVSLSERLTVVRQGRIRGSRHLNFHVFYVLFSYNVYEGVQLLSRWFYSVWKWSGIGFTVERKNAFWLSTEKPQISFGSVVCLTFFKPSLYRPPRALPWLRVTEIFARKRRVLLTVTRRNSLVFRIANNNNC